MREFKGAWLYIKKHTVTGMLYVGTTIRDPYKYLGSGTVWTRHIKKHGTEHVITLKVKWYDDPEKIKKAALAFSKKHNVAESVRWANLKEEDGINVGGAYSTESKKKIGKGNKGRYWYNDGVNTYKLRRDDPKIQDCQLQKGMLPSSIEKIRNNVKGRKHTDEAKEKNRQAHLGKKATPETIQKLSQAQSGENNGMFGKTHTEETRQRISAKVSAYITGDNNPMKNPETAKKISEQMKANNPAKGKHWYNNGVERFLLDPSDERIISMNLWMGTAPKKSEAKKADITNYFKW